MAEIRDIILRLPRETVERIDILKGSIEIVERRSLPRSAILARIVEAGCEVLERSLVHAVETGTDVAPQPEAIAATTLPPLLPTKAPPEEDIQIADAWAEYKSLGYRKFAQLLHERGIYSTIRKDGVKVPANPATLQKKVKRYEESGLL